VKNILEFASPAQPSPNQPISKKFFKYHDFRLELGANLFTHIDLRNTPAIR
jgi:hypothetical protein